MSKTRADLIKSITKLDLAEVLKCLNDGVNVNGSDSKNDSSLCIVCNAYHFSVEQRQTLFGIIELLILRGADINKKDANGWAPLHYAAASDFSAAVNILIQHKADVNMQTEDKQQTPLMIAAEAQKKTTIKLLLEKKADPTLVDKEKKDALKLARESNVPLRGGHASGFFSLMDEFFGIVTLLEEAKVVKATSITKPEC